MTDQPQHLAALARANEVRLAWSSAKKRIRSGDLMLDVVVQGGVAPADRDTLAVIERYTVLDVLTAGHRIGPQVARRIAQAADVPLGKRLGAATARQRTALAMAVGRYAPWCATATDRHRHPGGAWAPPREEQAA